MPEPRFYWRPLVFLRAMLPLAMAAQVQVVAQMKLEPMPVATWTRTAT